MTTQDRIELHKTTLQVIIQLQFLLSRAAIFSAPAYTCSYFHYSAALCNFFVDVPFTFVRQHFDSHRSVPVHIQQRNFEAL